MKNSFNNEIGWQFDNSYKKLSNSLMSKIKPTPVKSPKIILFNNSLSKEIDLNFTSTDDKKKAEIFSGNILPPGSETIAQAYAGHQFGHFTLLGDGRALIVGEHLTRNKKRFDIQYKGSGKTPYSRQADGRAALGPMLREYIISEAMNGLKIPTTRSLAVVRTGENVIRETILKGAILTRVASSHIRVGTFQYALISKNKNDLKSLSDYTINRHYPGIKKAKCPPAELLKTVLKKQISLICHWMRVGFIHGVMNTDNMTISGETIDYGPCAFMDIYDPKTVFSSIDHSGRYAYCNQPYIAKWNLERFAESLLPLIDDNKEKAITITTDILNEFEKIYIEQWLEMMRKKLGLSDIDSKDQELFVELLSWMHLNKVDYTNTFSELTYNLKEKNPIYKKQEFISWKKKWELRCSIDKNSHEESLQLMRDSNPLIIPRNNLVEAALYAAEENNFEKVYNLLEVLKTPYSLNAETEKYQSIPVHKNENYKTFCGT